MFHSMVELVVSGLKEIDMCESDDQNGCRVLEVKDVLYDSCVFHILCGFNGSNDPVRLERRLICVNQMVKMAAEYWKSQMTTVSGCTNCTHGYLFLRLLISHQFFYSRLYIISERLLS